MSENGDDIMKSALDIALEKTASIEAKEDPHALTPEEKAKVREINVEYDAKIAELEVQVTQRIRQLAETHGEAEVQAHMEMFQQEIMASRDQINAERQSKLDAYYQSIGK